MYWKRTTIRYVDATAVVIISSWGFSAELEQGVSQLFFERRIEQAVCLVRAPLFKLYTRSSTVCTYYGSLLRCCYLDLLKLY